MATQIVFDQEQMDAISDCLLIGLASYGEIIKVTNYIESMESMGHDVAKGLRPMDPTGSADTVSEFADVLRMIQGAARIEISPA